MLPTAGARQRVVKRHERQPSTRLVGWGVGADFGGLAVYLASDANACHSGDSMVIDGGHACFCNQTRPFDPRCAYGLG